MADVSDPVPGPAGAVTNALNVVREALRGRRAIAAVYRGLPLSFSPHVWGWRGEEAHALAFAVIVSREARTPPLGWQWLHLAELQDVVLQPARGVWLTAPGVRPPLDFVDGIEAQTG